MKIVYCRFQSPVGELLLASYQEHICMCDWVSSPHNGSNIQRISKGLNAVMLEGVSEMIDNTILQLNEYFEGERTRFDIPLLMIGTQFQKQVWNSLLEIPYGSIVSYADQAKQMGCPQSVRAVANANSRNAISIIVPCHRVIGSNDKLTGYAGGLSAKCLLLQIEGVNI